MAYLATILYLTAASALVAACDRLRIAWLRPFTINEEQFVEKEWHNIHVPRFLHKEILYVSSILRILFVTIIPLSAIIIWCAVLNWRINAWPCIKV